MSPDGKPIRRKFKCLCGKSHPGINQHACPEYRSIVEAGQRQLGQPITDWDASFVGAIERSDFPDDEEPPNPWDDAARTGVFAAVRLTADESQYRELKAPRQKCQH